ncbi:MAG: hypothetical protein RI883_2531 [Bacteroidota bacterium]|jgi:hypothetical protein
MLGLVLIYFIGKYFYQLAELYYKNKWVFAILGVITYYAGTIVFGFGLGLYAVMTENNSVLEINDVLIGLMALPFGLLSTWGLYAALKNNWMKKSRVISSELLDDN